MPGRRCAYGPTTDPSPIRAPSSDESWTRAPRATTESWIRAPGPMTQSGPTTVRPVTIVIGWMTVSRPIRTVSSMNVVAGSTTVTPDSIRR